MFIAASYHQRILIVFGLLLFIQSLVFNGLYAQATSPENTYNESSPFALPEQGRTATNRTAQPKPLGDDYYTNNLFAIERSDNPFALQTQGAGGLGVEAGQHDQSTWSQLFAQQSAPQAGATTQTLPQWLLLVFIIQFLYLTVVVMRFRKDIQRLVTGFFNSNIEGQLFREPRTYWDLSHWTIYGLFCLSMGTLVFLTLQVWGNLPFFSSGLLFLICVTSVGLLYGLKHVQLQLIQAIFPFTQEANYHSFAIGIFNKVISLFLVPLTFIVAYLPSAFRPSALLWSLLFIGLLAAYRWLKFGLRTSSFIQFHPFHWVIYMLTAEILPLLWLIKGLSF